MLEPAKSQGYLVIDYTEFSEVSRWVIEIYKNVGIDTLNYNLEETIIKRNTTYHHFDSTYFQIPGQYQYKINLYNAANQLIASQGSTNITLDDPLKCEGCGDFNKLCVHKCVGPDYAYELQRWFHPNNGSSTFKLMSTFNYFDNQTQTAVPYYEYMKASDYLVLSNFNNQQYTKNQYDISSNDIILFDNNGNHPNNKLIKFTNPYPNTIYKDKNGNTISSNNQVVYGVQKYLGSTWRNYNGVETPVLLHNNSTCSNNVQWASDVFNDYADVPGSQNMGMPQADELYCSGYSAGGVGGTGGNSGFPCEPGIADTLGFINGFPVVMKSPCVITIGPKNLIDITHEVQFIRIDTLNYSLILTKNQIISPSGEIITPDIFLKKGLYRINIFAEELELITFIFEVPEDLVIQNDQSDYLTPTIYPVPIVENQFQLKMKATAKVKFTYKLYDGFMNEIYSKNFVLQKDEERTHTIKPQGNGNIPQGFLYNQFIFEDGSLKTITTTKN